MMGMRMGGSSRMRFGRGGSLFRVSPSPKRGQPKSSVARGSSPTSSRRRSESRASRGGIRRHPLDSSLRRRRSSCGDINSLGVKRHANWALTARWGVRRRRRW